MTTLGKKENLSVCIIAKNEEKMLRDCILSVQSCAKEIIVVDTGSEDHTLDIAKQYGCIIIQSPWQNDFSQARNIALSHASYPFILSIDADERLQNPGLLQEIINKASTETGGWLVEVKSEAKRKDGGVDTYISNLLRLFRNKPNIKFTGIIHEQIIESILNEDLKLENSTLQILHLGYSHSHEQMQQKQLRNLELLDIQLKYNPNDSYSLYQRAKTYLALNNLNLAEIDIKKAIELTGKSNIVLPQALNYGGIISFQMKNFQLAIDRAEKSLTLVPVQAFANYILGEIYSAEQNFADAYEAYRRMQIAEETPDPLARIVGDYHLPEEQLHFRLGRSLIGLKLFDEAKKEFETGNSINPKDISCIVGLANVAFNNKQYVHSRTLLDEALNIEPDRDDVKNFLNQVDDAIEKERKFDMEMLEQRNTASTRIDFSIGKAISKLLLSLSMIVKNEEKLISGCLESVKDVVDEIVIVDTGSTDSTKEIAKRFGARVIDFEWVDDFAAARNESLKRCLGEWVLYLDADERLEANSAKKLRSLLKSSSEKNGGYICTIESDHVQLDGKTELHRGGYPRLFRNYGYPKIHFQGRVHEQITPSIFALGKTIDFSDLIIQHLGYNQSREVMEGKIKRNYQMLMQHIQEEPLNAYAWYQLAQTLAQMQLYTEAEKAIRFALQAGKLSDSVYASATATLAQLVGNQRKFDEALYWAERSLEKAPGQVYGLNLKAYALLYLKRPQEAEQLFLEVLRRLRSKKGVPQSGFDIVIPDEIVLKGLEEARKLITN